MAEIRVIGLEAIQLFQFARDMGDASEPLRDSMRFLNVALKRDTRQGKKVGGGTYEAYKPSYVKWLAKHGMGSGKKWLWISGKMMGDMQTRVGRKRAQIGYWGQGKSDMLANVHHKGRKDGTIPARPWMDWRRGYIDHISKSIFMPWLTRRARLWGIPFRAGF